jgi:hypothetical protein
VKRLWLASLLRYLSESTIKTRPFTPPLPMLDATISAARSGGGRVSAGTLSACFVSGSPPAAARPRATRCTDRGRWLGPRRTAARSSSSLHVPRGIGPVDVPSSARLAR